MRNNFIFRTVGQFFVLMVIWLLLSGHYDLQHISMGLISSFLVVSIHYRLRRYYFHIEELDEANAKLRNRMPIRIRFSRLLVYIPWLIWQIVIASLQVAAVVLRPKMPVDPSLITFKTLLPNIPARVILGNSITLTPGTITLQIEGDQFLVHALTDASFTGIADGSLPEEVAKLYEKKPHQVVSNLKVIKSEAEI